MGEQEGWRSGNLLEAAGQPWQEGGIPVLSRLSGWWAQGPGQPPGHRRLFIPSLVFTLVGNAGAFLQEFRFFFVGDAKR